MLGALAMITALALPWRMLSSTTWCFSASSSRLMGLQWTMTLVLQWRVLSRVIWCSGASSSALDRQVCNITGVAMADALKHNTVLQHFVSRPVGLALTTAMKMPWSALRHNVVLQHMVICLELGGDP